MKSCIYTTRTGLNLYSFTFSYLKWDSIQISTFSGYFTVLAKQTIPTTSTPYLPSSSACSLMLLPVVITSSIITTFLPTMSALIMTLESAFTLSLSFMLCLLSRASLQISKTVQHRMQLFFIRQSIAQPAESGKVFALIAAWHEYNSNTIRQIQLCQCFFE